MDSFTSLFGLKTTKKHKNVTSDTQGTSAKTASHSYFVNARSGQATEAIKLSNLKRDGRFEEVKVTLAPDLEENLITRAMVKRLGREDEIHCLEEVPSSPQASAECVTLKVNGCVELSVNFHQAGNENRSWEVTFIVVEELWDGIGLMLGKKMCETAKIVRGKQILMFPVRKFTEGNGLAPPAQLSLVMLSTDTNHSQEEKKRAEEQSRKDQEAANARAIRDDLGRMTKAEEEAEAAEEAEKQAKKRKEAEDQAKKEGA